MMLSKKNDLSAQGGLAARVHAVLASRARLRPKEEPAPFGLRGPEAEEGGCGVTGFACNLKVKGKHIFAPSVQMHNRGNGKGGGIAAVGLDPEQLGVDQETLKSDFLASDSLHRPRGGARPGTGVHKAAFPSGSGGLA